jgi:hypothetical protein
LGLEFHCLSFFRFSLWRTGFIVIAFTFTLAAATDCGQWGGSTHLASTPDSNTLPEIQQVHLCHTGLLLQACDHRGGNSALAASQYVLSRRSL